MKLFQKGCQNKEAKDEGKEITVIFYQIYFMKFYF